jgi:signal transduction histidine kinase
MTSAAATPDSFETVVELRALYRAAEARAARLRLVVEAGRDLATADADALAGVLSDAARRAALFSGNLQGRVSLDPDEPEGTPLIAPGSQARRVGTLVLEGGAGTGAADPEDQAALAMLAQLMAAAVDRIRRDAERETLLRTLRDRERRLETVVGRLFSAQEDERRRVSRDLHDGVAQTATALFRRLDAVGSEPLDAETARRAAEIARGLVSEIRAAIGDLRPTALDDLGLVPAVAAVVGELSDAGYDVVLDAEGPERWPVVLETAFFRVAQEAISNVRKHAGGPCRVEIVLSADPTRAIWSLKVRDFGQGFVYRSASPEPGERVGMQVMRERMALVGGTLETTPASPGLALTARVQRPW